MILINNEGKNLDSQDKKDFAAAVDAELAKSTKWYVENKIPPLSACRGKMVLMRRFPDSANGIDATGWPDNRAGDTRSGKILRPRLLQPLYRGYSRSLHNRAEEGLHR